MNLLQELLLVENKAHVLALQEALADNEYIELDVDIDHDVEEHKYEYLTDTDDSIASRRKLAYAPQELVIFKINDLHTGGWIENAQIIYYKKDNRRITGGVDLTGTFFHINSEQSASHGRYAGKDDKVNFKQLMLTLLTQKVYDSISDRLFGHDSEGYEGFGRNHDGDALRFSIITYKLTTSMNFEWVPHKGFKLMGHGYDERFADEDCHDPHGFDPNSRLPDDGRLFTSADELVEYIDDAFEKYGD